MVREPAMNEKETTPTIITTMTKMRSFVFDGFTTPTTGTSVTLMIRQDATGSRTITWGTSYKWPGGAAPVLSTGAGKRDVFSFISDGTNLYGSYLNDVR